MTVQNWILNIYTKKAPTGEGRSWAVISNYFMFVVTYKPIYILPFTKNTPK